MCSLTTHILNRNVVYKMETEWKSRKKSYLLEEKILSLELLQPRLLRPLKTVIQDPFSDTWDPLLEQLCWVSCHCFSAISFSKIFDWVIVLTVKFFFISKVNLFSDKYNIPWFTFSLKWSSFFLEKLLVTEKYM